MLKRRPRILALLFAIAATTALSLMAAPASHADVPLGPYSIELGDGMCIQTNPANNGADIQLVEEWCQPGNTAQQWYFYSLGGGDYHIRNAGNLNCMRARGNKDFSPVETIDCTQISDESWHVGKPGTPWPFAYHPTSNISTGGSPCLDVHGGSGAPGTVIDVFHCTSLNFSQTFFIYQ
jgi:Ricin-type beta-trefoil lectin domain-like